MRLQVTVIALLAATAAAHAQCPIGSFPTTMNGQQVCQSASGLTSSTGAQTCPPGYEFDFGAGGVRTCKSMDRNRQPSDAERNPRRTR